MTDKLLYEFASKLNKNKFNYESTKNQCNNLKKEAINLEKVIFIWNFNQFHKHLEKLNKEKDNAQTLEKKVHSQYKSTFKSNLNGIFL